MQPARCTTPLLLALALPAGAGGEPLEDHERNLHIPPLEEARDTLEVAAVHDADTIRIHYRYETDEPSWYHQYWRYEDGDWVAYGSGAPGPDRHGLYEDRISMMLDDGSVEGFERYGGWMLVHQGMRTLTSEADPEDVAAHPKLGEAMGRDDVRKYLPGSRDVDDPAEPSWTAVRDDEELDAMRDRGEFLDLWQWRAHRSHPMGYADNGYVLHYRLGSSGRSMFTHNRNADGDGPAWMFDPDSTGRRALDWDTLIERDYSQDDHYFLDEYTAVPFDPDHDWSEGDVLPQRLLRTPHGSRGAIRAHGGYADGAWRVTLTRSLDAPDPRDSKTLEDGERYTVAFAVHNRAGARWHRVSLPQTLGLDRVDADIVSVRADGALHDAEPQWVELPLIYPGQITWQWLNSDHPGSELVRAGTAGVGDFHDVETLQEWILEAERRGAADHGH